MGGANDEAGPSRMARQVAITDDAAAGTKPSSPRPQGESSRTPETALADAHTLKIISDRHDRVQPLPASSLRLKAARNAVAQDALAPEGASDTALQGRATALIAESASQHPAYKEALEEISPHVAQVAKREPADVQQPSAVKGDAKTHAGAGRRDGATADLSARFETLTSPSVSVKAMVSDSLTNYGYRAVLGQERTRWTPRGLVVPSDLLNAAKTSEPSQPVDPARAISIGALQAAKTSKPEQRAEPEPNQMRLEGEDTAPRRAMPPLEDRFNVKRVGLVEKTYHFRDQVGRVAFTDRLMSISTVSESPAAVKAMVDRAKERGWKTVRVSGSQEFTRQGWIAATAQGLTPVGHTPTLGDLETATKERSRLAPAPALTTAKISHEPMERTALARVAEVENSPQSPRADDPRQLATAIEKALVDGKVPTELRGQVRSVLASEGAKRAARGERVKVPVYDALAPTLRVKAARAGPQRASDRERSR